MLPGFDVGLSLMLTPHPSLVPLEMAAAGLVTVTNTFANKTAEALGAISANLIGAARRSTVSSKACVRRSRGSTTSRPGSRAPQAMTWPTDWDAAFPPETMARIEAFLAEG